jgi:ADP-heptose:LPS heptosyltransferase
VGQTTVEELTWVLDRADLFVGPDSGPMHLAIGRGTPVVALFGPTDPARCGPYQYEPAVVVRAERICPRCEVAYGRQMRQCLHTIDPEEAYCAAVGATSSAAGLHLTTSSRRSRGGPAFDIQNGSRTTP